MTTGLSNNAPSWSASRPPWWQSRFNHAVTLLQRLGFVVGAMHILAVPARRTGILHSTPVSLLTVDGERYIVACDESADWVLNARAAGHGILRRGRVDEHITLVLVPAPERVPILRALPRLAPGSVPAFRRLHGIPADPDAFASLAARCPVFRVERG